MGAHHVIETDDSRKNAQNVEMERGYTGPPGAWQDEQNGARDKAAPFRPGAPG
jgi:hypothetical protein